MLEQLLQELNNWFVEAVQTGDFTIAGGKLQDVSFLQDGQYYRIKGSVFNDGVYQYHAEPTEPTEPTEPQRQSLEQSGEIPEQGTLTDEIFEGVVWALAIPPAILRLAKDVEAWLEKNDRAINSPFQSESFGGYSYTKASAQDLDWKRVFKKRLNPYRKLKLF